jgi:hypothetical protein
LSAAIFVFVHTKKQEGFSLYFLFFLNKNKKRNCLKNYKYLVEDFGIKMN